VNDEYIFNCGHYVNPIVRFCLAIWNYCRSLGNFDVDR